MITLNARQTDALAELINITFGLTAARLSEMSDSRVLMEVPVVGVHPVQATAGELGPFISGADASVHQVFSGPISGDAILLMDYAGAVTLSNLFVEEHLRSQKFDSSTGEILTEVGNMLLSACLGMFGNLLQVHITFSVPQLHLESSGDSLASVSVGSDERRYALVITASFNIFGQGANGRIVIVLGKSSLDLLTEAVDRWEGSPAAVSL